MKLNFSKYIKLFSILLAVVTISILKDNVQAMSAEKAGQYVAEFAINFYNDHKDETGYTCSGWSNLYTGHRAIAYIKGEKTTYNGMSKYWIDCVGWVSFAYHHSLGIGASDKFDYFATPQQKALAGFENLGSIPESEYKPGDILVNSHHVMIYVGNNKIVDSAAGDGVSPGLKFRAPGSTSGTKVATVVRIKESTAASIDESNATTIYQGSGGISNAWVDGSGSTTSTAEPTQSSRIVDPNDKLPLYKHMLLTEKYNFNSITWNKYGHSDSNTCTMKEDRNLGLKYPEDSNIDLNKFIDFSLPYLQSWLIPLSMYSGAIVSDDDAATSNDTKFAYTVLKDAMSRIVVNRYDVETCQLSTKYKEYTVIEMQIIHTTDSEGNPETYVEPTGNEWDVNERLEDPLNLSSNVVKTKEEYVGKKVDVDTSYHIQDADTFDLTLSNTFEYTKYNDYDVDIRENADVENEARQEAYYTTTSGGGDDEQYGMVRKTDIYYVKKGFTHYIDRTWKDKLEQKGDSTISPYTYNDIKQYNNQFLEGNSNLNGITSEWLYDDLLKAIPKGSVKGSRLEDIRWLFPYAIAAAKSVNSQILPSVLVAQAIGEGGWGNISAANALLADSSAEVNLVGQGSLFGQKYIPGYEGKYPTLKVTGPLKQIEAYANNLTSGKYDGYNNAVQIVTNTSATTDEEYKNKVKGVIEALARTYCGYDISASEAYANDIYSFVENYDLWKLDKFYSEKESNGGIDLASAAAAGATTDSSNTQTNTTTDSTTQTNTNTSTDLSSFTNSDDDYYAILETDNEINRVDLVNSKSSNYLNYLLNGEQYSNHVGYSRAYLTYSYSELDDRLEKYFEDGTLPYFYGVSLGYSTYFESNYIDSDTILKTGDGIYSYTVKNDAVVSNGDSNPSNPPDNTSAEENRDEGYKGTFTASTGKTYKEYKQSLGPWKNLSYSQGTISNSGCGPTSVGIIVNGYGGQANVGEIAQFMKGPTDGNNIKKALKNFANLDSTVYSSGSNFAEIIKNNLTQGKPVIVSVSGTPTTTFTKNGHIMAVLDINSNNQVWVSNPNRATKNGWVDLDFLVKHMKSKYMIAIN